MRASILATVIALVAGCNEPVPSVRFRLAQGDTQDCGSNDCADVSLGCRTWMSIRIIDPAEPGAPYLSQCQEVPRNRNQNLCSIASVDLDPIPLPVQTLEVQVALYPEAMITTDPDTGEDLCPTGVQYDAVNGFPVEAAATPAVGGRAFYHPGDELVVVTLGCTDLEAVNDPVCSGTASVRVQATVDDFDTRASVVPFEADRLSVAVGEPRFTTTSYVLNPGDLSQLDRSVVIPPAWAVDLAELFRSYACLAVLDDTPQSTTTVTCQRASLTDDEYAFPSTGAPPGVRLGKTSLDQILRALDLTQFPTPGITIGLVLDRDGRPLAGQAISAPGATVQYLSSDRNTVVGSTTTASGVFVSTDAPFGTMFSTTSGVPPETPTGIGGRIDGKVTVVVLRFTGPVIGGG